MGEAHRPFHISRLMLRDAILFLFKNEVIDYKTKHPAL
jgi:hypothetical protein